MRIPLSWIKEYIQLDKTPDEIAQILTMAGIEVDGLEATGSSFKGVIVGKVLEVEKHPDADKLVVAKVRVGSDIFQVVCGAPNCRPGLKVAFAPVGATLENGEFQIKKSKIRGIESSGMLCSAQELQIGEEADGIMELPEDSVEGTSLNELYGDTIFEISLTPNLGHCASVLGLARELSAATSLPILHPTITIPEANSLAKSSVQVKVQDPEACPRYTCRVIKDLKVAPSPEWLKSKIEKCGLRSINNVVDITNYVLLELGHPLHAFDLEKIQDKEIIVQKANEGALFQTLDAKDRVLKNTDLVICDAQGPVALAGVMGGQNSEVNDATVNIVLESAYFNPVTIRKTSKQLGLQTDSSKRFERGTDPNVLTIALDRATQLILQVAGGLAQEELIDIKAKEFLPLQINCRLSRINQLLGLALSRGEVEDIFKRLGFKYQFDGEDVFLVKVPTYRVDITIEVDLIEEVARIYGYDNIPRQGGKHHSSSIPPAPIYLFEQEVRTRLIAEGLQEFLTCDLVGPTLLNIVQDDSMPKEAVVTVMNPTSIEQSILRTSLLPGLLQVVKYNIDHQNHHIGGFEVGRIHFKAEEQYKEPYVAAIILSGVNSQNHWLDKPKEYDFYDLKGIIENLLSEFGIADVSYKNLTHTTLHTGRQASIFVNGLEIGTFGEVHPDIQRRLDVSQRILFAELNMHDLMQVSKRKDFIQKLALFPGSMRDWTITIKASVPYQEIIDTIKEQKSSLLEDVQILDIYRSEKLPVGYQNMTLRFGYRDPSKTISQEIVDAEHQRLTGEVVRKIEDSIKI
jgi:phenylalanyl-tRNA synthetase beta chain